MVVVGKIVRSQGNKGELRLKLYVDYSITPFFQRVYLQEKRSSREFEVESIRPYKDYYLLKLKEVDSLGQAQELAGLEVSVPEGWLQPLAKGDYYFFQIIGCSVWTKKGEKIGVAKEFLFIGSNDLLVVRKGKREILIPFTQSICVDINPQKKEIIIDPPEGLLELNEI